MRSLGRHRQRRIDRRRQWVNQFGPARIPQPEVGSATPAEMAPCRTPLVPDHRLIDAKVLLALDRERLARTAEVDGEAAAARGFPANRAVAEVERVGMRRLQRKSHRAARTRSFQPHWTYFFFRRCAK